MAFQLDFVGIEPGESLTRFIDRQVNPDSNYLAACGTCTKEVVDLMHSKLVPYSVAETIKGGSLGKGTAVKGMSDADLLFPLNNIKSVPELMQRVGRIQHEIHSALCGNGTRSGAVGLVGVGDGDKISKQEAAILRKQEKERRSYTVSDIKRTPFAVSFNMKQKDNSSEQNVDLLPIPKITDNPSKFTKDQLANIYKEMKEHPEQRDFYGKCLSPLQVSFVSQQPEKVKRAIRLVKYWAKTNDHKIPSYAIELLTIKKYEDFQRPQPGGISEEKIVTSVFDELRNPRNIKIAWDKNYNPDDFGRPDGPYILDPANPYHNLFRKKNRGVLDSP